MKNDGLSASERAAIQKKQRENQSKPLRGRDHDVAQAQNLSAAGFRNGIAPAGNRRFKKTGHLTGGGF